MTFLHQKTVLITGATSGIGKSVAVLLAKKKCKLVCIGRNKEKLENLKTEICNNVPFYGFVCDLTSEKGVMNLMKRISEDSIKIDILIHSAGSVIKNSVIDSSTSEFDYLFNLNVKAPFLITKLFLSDLIENKGQIVFLNSSAIQRAIPNLSLYSASKSALKGFTDSLRQEVNEFGVRVICVYPGQTATPLQQELYESEKRHYYPERLLQTNDIASLIINTLELPETAEVTDLYVRPLMKK
jgi:short-subunit dehydrogenase